MTTVYQVDLAQTQQGKQMFSIFHLFDGNDNLDLADAINYFRIAYVLPLKIFQTEELVYNHITIRSLTAVNPGELSEVLDLAGNSVSDPMPTGVHVYVKLVSGDPSFRSGGKLVPGQTEGQFQAGDPTNALLDGIQSLYDAFISGMDSSIGASLAIYRPTLSLPGLPQVSIVASALVRGDSTNNRRHRQFER